MNDRPKHTVIKPASQERQRSHLIEGFIKTARSERESAYRKGHSANMAKHSLVQAFRVLLEQCGFPLIDEAYTTKFWEDVNIRMEAFLTGVQGLKNITKIDEDHRLDQWVAEKIQAYGKLIHGPAPLEASRGGFASSILRFLR